MKIVVKKYYYFDQKENNNFKIFLLKKNKTLIDFANEIGISISLVYAITSGYRPITPTQAKKFEEYGYKLDIGD